MSAVWILERECGDEGWEIAGIAASEFDVDLLKGQMLLVTTTYVRDDGEHVVQSYSEYGIRTRGPLEIGVLFVEGNRTVEQRESLMTPEQLKTRRMWEGLSRMYLRAAKDSLSRPFLFGPPLAGWVEGDDVPTVEKKS